MGILTETLGGRATYGNRPTRRSTIGKIIPVPKRDNPYIPRAKDVVAPTSTQPNSNLLGSLAQIKNQGKPVSTAINVNYESDPVLARIRALNTQNVANARTEAEALRKQAVIETGFDDVGARIGLDENTQLAARNNPFSTRALIQKESTERGRDLDESLNQQNLFFSGARADRLGELGFNTAQATSEAGKTLQQLLAGIDTGVLEAEQYAAQQEQAAIQQAAFEAQQAALQQAYMDALSSSLYGDPDTGLVNPNLSVADPNALVPGVGYTDVGGQMIPGGVANWNVLDEQLGVDDYALMQALGLV
jgi:hypothetical protein